MGQVYEINMPVKAQIKATQIYHKNIVLFFHFLRPRVLYTQRPDNLTFTVITPLLGITANNLVPSAITHWVFSFQNLTGTAGNLSGKGSEKLPAA